MARLAVPQLRLASRWRCWRLAILINLSLFFFNLLPIPPLDGSRLVRNLLPYNAVVVYDRIPIWVSYLIMIFVGGFILRLLLGPALGWFSIALLRTSDEPAADPAAPPAGTME